VSRVARGISAFERYAVLERAGQAHLALAAGRVEVRSRPAVRLLDGIQHWAGRVTHYASGDGPASLGDVARALDRAMFDFARRPDGPAARRLLEAVGAAESALAVSVESAGGGPRPLRAEPAQEWLELADDASAEFALAACLASLHDKDRSGSPAIRDYLHGTILGEHGRVYEPARKPLVARSAPVLRRLAALHARRHLDAAGAGRERLSFDFAIQCPRRVVAMLSAPAAALDGERIMRLALGLSLLDFRAVTWRPRADTTVGLEPQPGHALLALAFAGTAEVPLTPRPGWVTLLAAGHTRTVLADALLRLRMVDLQPIPTAADLALGAPSGLGLAVALMFALSRGDRAVLSRRLLLASDDASAMLTHTQGGPV
jgi:CRISPR-associated protein Csx17